MSKLKQRRLQSKLKTKQLKNERKSKRKSVEQNRIKISTNEMYPGCKPLSEDELESISSQIKSAKLNNLKLSENLGKEDDDGFIEFKWKLICPLPERIQHLVTQMRYRINEGNGKCIYQIGVEDNGNPKGLSDVELNETIKTIYRLNKQLNGNIEISAIKRGLEGKVATLTVVNQSVLQWYNVIESHDEENVDLSGVFKDCDGNDDKINRKNE
eukprot:224492_1